MSTQWRALFDSMGVAWRDRGRNCSRGHVNICCPFCLDDASFHCAVSESKPVFYCYRVPQHKGHVQQLLQFMLRSRLRADALLDTYTDELPPPERVPEPFVPYDRFLPASDNPTILKYLLQRGFTDPYVVCKRFNLRYAREGRYAARLLLPLIDSEHAIRSFVGRAVRHDLQPSYKIANPELATELVHGMLTGKTLILVEGPMDALKINAGAYAHLHDVSAVAMLGKALTHGRLDVLFAQNPKRVLLCLDNDTYRADRGDTERRMVGIFKSIRRHLECIWPPDGMKDTGEIPEADVIPWLRSNNAIPVGRKL